MEIELVFITTESYHFFVRQFWKILINQNKNFSLQTFFFDNFR